MIICKCRLSVLYALSVVLYLEREPRAGGRRGRGREAGGDGGALAHGEGGDVPVAVGVVRVERGREEDGRADLRLAAAGAAVHVVFRPEFGWARNSHHIAPSRLKVTQTFRVTLPPIAHLVSVKCFLEVESILLAWAEWQL